jgi:hypothetical protein
MEPDAVDAAVRALVDQYRSQCLWFLREDYYPTRDVERERVVRLIERHGSLDAFQRVATIRSWLLQRSNDASSAS